MFSLPIISHWVPFFFIPHPPFFISHASRSVFTSHWSRFFQPKSWHLVNPFLWDDTGGHRLWQCLTVVISKKFALPENKSLRLFTLNFYPLHHPSRKSWTPWTTTIRFFWIVDTETETKIRTKTQTSNDNSIHDWLSLHVYLWQLRYFFFIYVFPRWEMVVLTCNCWCDAFPGISSIHHLGWWHKLCFSSSLHHYLTIDNQSSPSPNINVLTTMPTKMAPGTTTKEHTSKLLHSNKTV